MVQVPFEGAVFVVYRIGNRNVAAFQKVCEQNEMPIVGQGSPAHQSDQNMAGGEKLCYMFAGAVGNAFYMKAVGIQRVRNQAVIGTAVEGIISVFRCPVGQQP